MTYPRATRPVWAAAEKRRPGFAIQAAAASVLLVGALGRVIYLIAINCAP